MNMGQSSFQKYVKMEEQEVPDTTLEYHFFTQSNNFHVNKNKGILGINEDEENMGDFNWEIMKWEDYSYNEELEDECIGDQIKVEETSSMFFQEEVEGHFGNNIVKREEGGHGFWDDIDHEEHENEDEKKSKCLNLSLNYQQVLDAWSDRGSLWAGGLSPSTTKNGYMGEVPVLMEEERTRREASVLRYKEKRQSRLFSKKIRYQVRKLNADKRPRLKGRFVKKLPEKIFK